MEPGEYMKKLINKINHWRFDKKMQLLMTITVTLTTMLMLIVSTVSSVTFMKEQSVELVQEQNNTIEENLNNSLDNYKSLAWAIVLNNSIQNYLKGDRLLASVDAYDFLSSISNMYSNLNFVTVIDEQNENYIYRGKTAISATSFLQVYQLDYNKCKSVQSSTIKISYNNAYYKGKQYSLNIYFPLYDTERIFKELGLLCMNFSDPNLDMILHSDKNSAIDTAVVDMDGMIIASRDESEIGQYVNYTEDIRKNTDRFSRDGKMYTFQKLKGWDLYVVSCTPTIELYKSSISTILAMTVILILILFISTRITKSFIRKTYKPLDKVLSKMDDVAAGTLDTRINVGHMGEDFMKLAVGFNTMMDRIQLLMEQVKEEQHQVEQIRFNALQSQIQPHFLYNTLECIHWQAMVDGNKEISTLVKALAKYYRICLSNGKDVISLEMELDHIKNYLIIQNTRYDNIIESVFDVDSEIEDTKIPKLTLQPLVENSIYHGMKVQEGKKGTLFVSAGREEEHILITISDTGSGMDEKTIAEMNQKISEYEDTFGYGVRNVNKRIELLYGKKYGLHYLKNESGGVTVEIRVPYVTEMKEDA